MPVALLQPEQVVDLLTQVAEVEEACQSIRVGQPLELGRALPPDVDPTRSLPLPDSLGELISARLGLLPATTRDALALVALRSGDSLRAARLSGAVSNLERTSGTGLNLWNREVLGFDPQTLRSDPALADAWAAGEVMTAHEAVAYALTE